MLTLTKACVNALIGSAAVTGCRVAWLKDRGRAVPRLTQGEPGTHI